MSWGVRRTWNMRYHPFHAVWIMYKSWMLRDTQCFPYDAVLFKASCLRSLKSYGAKPRQSKDILWIPFGYPKAEYFSKTSWITLNLHLRNLRSLMHSHNLADQSARSGLRPEAGLWVNNDTPCSSDVLRTCPLYIIRYNTVCMFIYCFFV